MSWLPHLIYIAKKISRNLYILSRLKHKMTKNCLLSLYYSLIYPYLNYCIIAWGSANKTVLRKIEILQKGAVRLVDKAFYFSHTGPIFKKCNLSTINDIFAFACCLFMYKFKASMLPCVCSNLLTYEILII